MLKSTKQMDEHYYVRQESSQQVSERLSRNTPVDDVEHSY